MNDLTVTDFTVLSTDTTTSPDDSKTAEPMTESESFCELLGRYVGLGEVHEEMTVDNFNTTRDLILRHVDACAELLTASPAQKRAYAEAFCDEQELAYCMSLSADRQHWTKGNKKTPPRLLVGKTMGPGFKPYQSAKSVILCAIGEGIELHAEDGEALGKTALQNALKEAKSPQEKIISTVETLKKLLAQCDDRESQAAWIIAEIRPIYEAAKEAAAASAGADI